MLVYNHFIKDPVHGYIGITDLEKCVIDSSPVQRLRRILQLPTSQYVYPGATHTRFSHSIGSMHIAGLMSLNILNKILPSTSDDARSLQQFMRLVLLLHDVGHGPYSHTFEEAVLYPMNINHEIIGSKIVYENNDIRYCLETYGKNHIFDHKDLSQAISSRTPSEWPLLGIKGSDEYVERSFYYILKGSFSADILDYLMRDSYYTGAGYGNGVDWVRIAYNLIPTSRGLALNEKALDAFEHVIIARYHMFMSVYYHKTSRAIDIMISEALKGSFETFKEYIEDPERYLLLDEYSILMIPEFRENVYIKDLMKRKIRFTAVEEYRIPIHRDINFLTGILDRERLNKILYEKIPENMRGKVFIDTPILPLNPMFHSEDLLIYKSDRSVVLKRFEETTLGHLAESVVVVRLYIDKEFLDKKNEALSIFREVLKIRGIRSFY
ncbi:MAG: HD domain-containing protein [Desulfurococcales archaeon]|jgi:HD superfamily phosphohydrolase|nr:HD domain-containing protein [Desulfurococcales archaeon]